jgi:fructoselysine-6-P-deglycase FrlB-like protein
MLDDYITFAAARAGQTAALRGAIPRIAAGVAAAAEQGRLAGAGPIFLAVGASLAAAAAPTWALRSRGVDALRLGAGDHPLPLPASDHPVVAVSQSGRSAETLAALQTVDPALRFAVTNAHPSPISQAADAYLSLGNLPDSYASTIGYTATVTGLGMLADAWDGGAVASGWAHLPDLLDSVEAEVGARADRLGAPFAGATSADFVGAGPSVGSAEAGALLFREVVRIPSAAMSTRQYLHGAMESAGGGVHVILGDRREADVAHTLSAAGHPVVLVTSEAVAPGPGLQVVRLPAVPPAQRAVLEAVVLQVLVGQVARAAGIDVEEFVFHHDDTKVTSPAPSAAADAVP